MALLLGWHVAEFLKTHFLDLKFSKLTYDQKLNHFHWKIYKKKKYKKFNPTVHNPDTVAGCWKKTIPKMASAVEGCWAVV